eukprot:2593845-Pleurochrysis_carterae.AAC.1
MFSPLGGNRIANVRKIVSWSYVGSRATATLSSRVLAGSGKPISGVWHRRMCHPRSPVKPGIGVIGRIGAAVLWWTFRAKLARSSSVASVWPHSDSAPASYRSSSSCPSGS